MAASVYNLYVLDLVFLQNGMILPWLQQRGLESNTQVLQRHSRLPTQFCTQALIYFAVPSLGSRPIDGITEVDPDGLTKGLTLSTCSPVRKLRCFFQCGVSTRRL